MRFFGNPKEESNKKDSKKESKSKEKFTLFKGKSEEKQPEPKIAEAKEELEIPRSQPSSKTGRFIEEVQKLDDKTIKPFVDFNEGNLFYPILSKTGEPQDNFDYLETLANDGILEKKIAEKLVVCPVHSDNFASSVRLYCQNCESVNVQKLNLFEHKNCGHISDSTEYQNGEGTTCPGCHKQIVNFEKQIRIPAMWYQCEDCHQKSDNVTIKLHCRKYDHDFDIRSAKFETVYNYHLKHEEKSISSDTSQIKDDLIRLLEGFEFKVERNASVIGNSGNSHTIPIHAKGKSEKDSLLLFVKGSSEGINESDVNAVLVPMLDICPKGTMLITTADVPENIMNLASQYRIKIICDKDLAKISTQVEEFLKESLRMVEARET